MNLIKEERIARNDKLKKILEMYTNDAKIERSIKAKNELKWKLFVQTELGKLCEIMINTVPKNICKNSQELCTGVANNTIRTNNSDEVINVCTRCAIYHWNIKESECSVHLEYVFHLVKKDWYISPGKLQLQQRINDYFSALIRKIES